MKFFKLIPFFLVGVMSLLSSCRKDFLKPELLSVFAPENSFNTPEGLEATLQSAAKEAAREMMGAGGTPRIQQTILSDVGVQRVTDNRSAKNFTADITSDDGALRGNVDVNLLWYWDNSYVIVKFANTVITYIDVPDWGQDAASQSKRNALLGGGYFWRAYAYYYLVTCFGDVPWVGGFLTEPKIDFYSTKKEVILQKLKEDLEFAAEWVPDNVDKGKVTKGAVLHLLTKVNLALGLFDDAIASASKVIDGGVYELMTSRFGIDKNDASKNVVWDLHRPENKSLPENKEGLLMMINRADLPGNFGAMGTMRIHVPFWNTSSAIKTPTGKRATVSNIGIEYDLHTRYGRGIGIVGGTWYATHDIWNNAGADLRHAPGNWVRMEDLVYNDPALKKANDPYYGQPFQKYNSTGGILVTDTVRCWYEWPHYKFYVYNPQTATTGQAGGYTDWYLYRLADTYLLRAEAYLWKDNPGKAAEDINKIRARAQAPILTAGEVNMATLLEERARELYFEEPRKSELTRMAYIYAKTGKVAPTGKTYSPDNLSQNNFWYDWVMLKNEFYGQGVPTIQNGKYSISPYLILWPVPRSEIEANINGVINQNPGYTGAEKNVPPLTEITD